eukprot:TRINITY_DN1359_c0_g1_i1.p2 TRINITY_DN1359_c0_g1~~TRINITY_DN1359_c0_g1_i1.p2  ORF type:complete len:84 (-),score=17.28 TRINITY_DN1359_c0_g1_i1:86-337(-)
MSQRQMDKRTCHQAIQKHSCILLEAWHMLKLLLCDFYKSKTWKQEGDRAPKDDLIFATSKLINGNTLLAELAEVVKGGGAPGF